MVKRIITALIGLPIIIAILLFANKYIMSIIIAVTAGITLWEYFNAFKIESLPPKILGYVSCLLIILLQFTPLEYRGYIAGAGVPAICSILFIQVILTNMKITVKDAIISFFGIAYIVGFLIFLPLLYGEENGKILIWYLFIAAWGNDSFAYLVGSRIGKKKITPISPKKSLEGCIGGLAGAIIIAMIFTYIFNTWFGMNFSYLLVGIILFVLTLLSQFGDLAASTIKRYTGIKDSGSLFPGHGGMLDRIDSILFITPFAYFLLMLL